MTLKDVPHSPGIAGRIATALADGEVNIDMIIQNEPVSAGKLADISFTIPRSKLAAARDALAPLESELGIEASADERMGKVSIIGAGMKSHPAVAAKVFTVLGDEGVNIEMIATSPIKISCVIAGDAGARRRARAARRVRALGPGHDPARAAVRGVRMSRAARRGRRRHRRGRHGHAAAAARARVPGIARSCRSPRSARSGACSTAASPSRRSTTSTSRASTSRCSPPARRARASGRSGSSTRARSSSTTRAPSARTPTSRSSSPRSTPTRSTRHNGIVANPNCTTMVAMLPLKALHDAFDLRAMVATSYQAAGGAGQKGIDELAAQVAPLAADVRAALRRRRRGRREGRARRARGDARVQRRAAARHDRRGGLHRRGAQAARRVAQDPRDPGPRGLADVRARAGHGRPRRRRPRDVRARGRPRRGARRCCARSRTSSSTTSRRRSSTRAATRSPSGASAATSPIPHSLNFFVVGDNLLKGAALNTVQLAEVLHERGLVGARV